MAIQLELESAAPQVAPQERLLTVFYTKLHYHVFYDEKDRQLAFTEREFKLLEPHLEGAMRAIKEAGLLDGVEKKAGIIYDLALHKFKLVGTNKDPEPHQIIVDNHLRRLNEAARFIHFHIVEQPDPPKNLEADSSYKDIIRDTHERLKKSDMNQFMEDFTKDTNCIHLMDPKETDLDYEKLKQQDHVFITLTKNNHATALAFDPQNKTGYFYDPAGHALTGKSAKNLCNKLKKQFGIKKIPHNPVDHQKGDFHCGRYVLNFFKQIAEHPQEFNFETFCHKKDRTIDEIVNYLLDPKSLSSQPNGLTKTHNDCFLNAILQTLLTSDQASFYCDANNLIDKAKSKNLHNQFVQLMDAYKKGLNPSTHAFRKLLGFDDTRQHDATEALEFFLEHYKNHAPLLYLNASQSSSMQKTLQDHTSIHTPAVYIAPQLTDWDAQSKQTVKLNYHREIPLTFQTNGQTYQLKSFVTHHGDQITNGHYTADVMLNNQWFSCNDTVIAPIDNPLEKARSACLLHYERTGTPALAGG